MGRNITAPKKISDAFHTEKTLHTSSETIFATVYRGTEIRSSIITDLVTRPKEAGTRACTTSVLFWRCGSADHILGEQKCTTTLESIKTDVIDSLNCDLKQAYNVRQQYHRLYLRKLSEVEVKIYTQYRYVIHRTHVHFESLLCGAAEHVSFDPQVAARFRSDEFNIHIIASPSTHETIVGCSYIQTNNYSAQKKLLRFVVK